MQGLLPKGNYFVALNLYRTEYLIPRNQWLGYRTEDAVVYSMSDAKRTT